MVTGGENVCSFSIFSIARHWYVYLAAVSPRSPSARHSPSSFPPSSATPSRGVGPSLARWCYTLPHPEPLIPPCALPPLYRATHTYVRSYIHVLSLFLSSSAARMRTHTRAQPRIISKTKEGEFPSRWGRLEGRRAPRWLVGRGCGSAAATERRSAVGTLDRMIRPFAKGYFSLAAISRSANRRSLSLDGRNQVAGNDHHHHHHHAGQTERERERDQRRGRAAQRQDSAMERKTPKMSSPSAGDIVLSQQYAFKELLV